MIEIIEGRGVGSGKSYYVVTRIIKHLIAGGTVYYSDTLELIPDAIASLVRIRYGVLLESSQMVSVPREEMARIHEVTPAGTDEMPVLIVMDEAQRYLNARDHADKSKRPLFEWCCESRHDSNDLIFITQNALNIDNQIRRLVTYVTRVRNMVGFKIGGVRWPFRQFLVHIFDGDGKTSMEKKFISHDKGIFACYQTKSMKGSHKRLLGDPIPKRKLQKVKGSKRMKFLIVIFVAALVVGGGLIYKVLNRGLPGFSAPAVAASDTKPVQSSPSPAASFPATWTTRKEAFRGIIDNSVLRTIEAEYRVNAMSPGGFCVGIDPVGRVALLRDAAGALIYVVAVEERLEPVAIKQTPVKEPNQLDQPVVAKPDKFGYLGYGERIAIGLGNGDHHDWGQTIVTGPNPRK